MLLIDLLDEPAGRNAFCRPTLSSAAANIILLSFPVNASELKSAERETDSERSKEEEQLACKVV